MLGDELEMVWKGALYADDDFRVWFFQIDDLAQEVHRLCSENQMICTSSVFMTVFLLL
jgi:hypothetical protein